METPTRLVRTERQITFAQLQTFPIAQLDSMCAELKAVGEEVIGLVIFRNRKKLMFGRVPRRFELGMLLENSPDLLAYISVPIEFRASEHASAIFTGNGHEQIRITHVVNEQTVEKVIGGWAQRVEIGRKRRHNPAPVNPDDCLQVRAGSVSTNLASRFKSYYVCVTAELFKGKCAI